MSPERPKKIANVADVVRQSLKSGRLTFSKHARKRMDQRNVIQSEVFHVLRGGKRFARKDKLKSDRWSYAFRRYVEGSERWLQVNVGIEADLTVVVTVIDLDQGK